MHAQKSRIRIVSTFKVERSKKKKNLQFVPHLHENNGIDGQATIRNTQYKAQAPPRSGCAIVCARKKKIISFRGSGKGLKSLKLKIKNIHACFRRDVI